MPSIALISPAAQSEIAYLTDAVLTALHPVPGFADPLPGIDLSGVREAVKPQTSRRLGFNQRDITRLLRGAKTAGVEARVVIEDGRITLAPTKQVLANADTDENPWEKFRHG
jgi:hypothetical protein